MSVKRSVSRRVNSRIILLSVLLAVATVSSAFHAPVAHAAQITNRSLSLLTGNSDSDSDGINDGGSKPGGVVNHQFTFTVPSTANIGSIQFEYCTIASVDACVTPTGLHTTGATLGDESASAAKGFSIVSDASTDGAPYLTRGAVEVSAGSILVFRLDGITNPTTANETFFVRITTFTSTTADAGAIDTGTVAASTSKEIVLTGTMPESIIFCTGATITANGTGIPDCTSATSGVIAFDQLFSPTDTATAKSQMAASTNASAGYSISVTGPTLTSGSNTIPAMASPAASAPGTGQFGLNLVANPLITDRDGNPIGSDITPAADAPNDLRGQPLPDYATANVFKFVPGATGEAIANSASGGAGPTNGQIYTVSYIVNVAGSQTAGTYSTTLTYICTATF